MCGIAGFWGPPLPPDESRGILRSMCAAMARRGPDASGIFTAPPGGPCLAHTRLSILDLSEFGAQPMSSPDGRLTIVFNGEIYNYLELRKELEAASLAPQGGWRGSSDTEALLALAGAYAFPGCLEKLVGMFALALWDEAAQTLTLVRDRLGIKPLHVGFAGKSLVFGSDLKPFMAHPDFERRVDRDALTQLLRHLYIPEPHCIFRGVKKLEPGCLLTVTRADIEARRLPEPRRYWDVNRAAEYGLAHPLADPKEAEERLEALLKEAVASRMIADVPLGAFLSGGIDSSSVVALMQEASTAKVRTFSIGFNEGEYNEADHARAVADHLGTDHSELTVTPEQAMAVIPELPEFYDEPYADVSQIPTYLVSVLARESVTVSLSGDGGDELFAGYNRYSQAPRIWNALRLAPRPARTLLAAAMRAGGENFITRLLGAGRPLIFTDKLQKVTEAMDAVDRREFFRRITSYWTDPKAAVPGAVEPATRFTTASAMPKIDEFVPWMMAMDQATYLPGDILTKVDRASMAASLEARVPLIDHRVVELSWRIPLSVKLAGGRPKGILRNILSRRVPDALMERPKQGFAVPVEAWLRGPLRPWAEELLGEAALARHGFFDPAPIRRLWEDHLSGRRNYQYHLWPVLMFQSWAAAWL